MTPQLFREKFSDWRVYLYKPRNGAIRCPHCNQIVTSIKGNPMSPPYICEKDKIFFDLYFNSERLDSKSNVISDFYAGNLESLYSKYQILHHVGMS